MTSGGFSEAVIVNKADPSKTLLHNKSIDYMKSTMESKKLIP